MRLSPVSFIRGLLGDRGCRACETCPMGGEMEERKILLFGSPNVGKSVIFGELTGSYAVVSNYPGTTVEVSRGRARMGDLALDVVDSPGTYSLAALSEDEEVARDLLLDEPLDLVLHCTDARQLQRMLPLTVQLIEAGLPVALDVNVIDEAERAGLSVDVDVLSRELGIPVVATAASSGVGVEGLKGLVSGPIPAGSGFAVEYPGPIESAASRIDELLKGEYRCPAGRSRCSCSSTTTAPASASRVASRRR